MGGKLKYLEIVAVIFVVFISIGFEDSQSSVAAASQTINKQVNNGVNAPTAQSNNTVKTDKNKVGKKKSKPAKKTTKRKQKTLKSVQQKSKIKDRKKKNVTKKPVKGKKKLNKKKSLRKKEKTGKQKNDDKKKENAKENIKKRKKGIQKSGNSGKKSKGRKRNKVKKEMKLKGINIIKGTKKKEKKNVYGKTVRATCPTASCVSYQTTALSLELTVVRNFLAQYNRISKKLSLMKNKFLKKNARNGTAGYLADRIGSSMDRNGPLCNGDFNNTEALSAHELLTELNSCDSTIGTICGAYTTVPEATLAELDVCAQTMTAYQDKSKECGAAATNCKCWEEMIVLSKSVKACNKAKDVEDGIKSDYNGCISSFTSCSKLEDKAPTLMQKCYTSLEKQMILIKTYLEILDSTDKVSTTVDAIISSSNKELGARRKRQTSSSKPCKDFLTAVSAFLTVLSGSNLDGKSPEVSNLGKSVVGMVVEVCSISEIASLQTSKKSLAAARKKVSERLNKIQSVIQALTQTTVSVSSVVLATFPIPDKLGVVQPTTTAQTTPATGPTTAATGTTRTASNSTTAAPGPTTAAPGLSTAAPGLSTSAPGLSTTAPGLSTVAPGPTTAAPGPTTAAPGPTTAAPGPTTAAPGPTTAASGPTTAAPGPTTAAPGPTTAAPGPTTAAPGPNTAPPKPSTTTIANSTTTTAVVTELAMPVKVVFSLVSVTMVG